MPVLILTGPPGVGKTTAAASLVTRFPRAAHLESDHLFRFIRSGFVEPWRPESNDQNAAVMRIVASAAAGYASAGYFTVVDGILIPGRFLESVRDALREGGNRVAVAILRAPRARLPRSAAGARSWAGPRSGGDPAALAKLRRGWRVRGRRARPPRAEPGRGCRPARATAGG